MESGDELVAKQSRRASGDVRDFSDGRLFDSNVFCPTELSCYSVAFSEVLTISYYSA